MRIHASDSFGAMDRRLVSVTSVLMMLVPACGTFLGLDDEGERPDIPPSSATDASAGSDADPSTTRDGEADPDAPVAAPCASCASKRCTPRDGGVDCDPLVFVTDETFAGDFTEIAGLTGIAKIDEACQRWASAAGIAGKVFKAWASIEIEGVTPDRLAKSSRPYRRVDGVVVAANHQALLTSALENRITLTAQGIAVPDLTPVWTAAFADGGADPRDCGRWSDGTTGASGMYGITSCTPQQPPCTPDNWSYYGQAFCNERARLYCFEQLP